MVVHSESAERRRPVFCSPCDCGGAGTRLGGLQVIADRAVRKLTAPEPEHGPVSPLSQSVPNDPLAAGAHAVSQIRPPGHA